MMYSKIKIHCEVYMKNLKKYLTLFCELVFIISGIVCISSCANDSSDSSSNTSVITEPAEGTLTEGSISANVLSKNTAGQNVATLTDSNGGTYVFTESSQTQSARAAVSISGTWIYKQNGVVKYSGSFTGDISKIGKEAVNIELTVTKTTNSINEGVKVLNTKTFKMELTTSKFSAVLPTVISGVMDLRIKGGNVANVNNVYDCNKTIEWGTPTGETFTKGYVTATVYTNGIYFVVNRPSEDCYLAGWGGTVNPVEADGKKSTRLYLTSSGDDTKRSGFWPLCIKGKKIKLSVYVEPVNVDQYRELTHDEIFEITPAGGIGEIDYSNYDAKKWFTYGWENGKPVIKFDSSELVLPNGANLKTRIAFYAGTGVWENNATIWIDAYQADGAVYEINLSDDYVNTLKSAVEKKGKSQIYYEYYFQFSIPGLTDQEFTTKIFPSAAVDIK